MAGPNIVLIVTDDQRFDTIHAAGNQEIRTPNLDKLFQESVCFRNAYIQGGTSGAVCMPSRAMLHSGRSLFRIQEKGEEIPTEHMTLGECFKNAGYETFGIGKWHNGSSSYSRSFTGGDEIFFGGMWDHWNVPVCHFHPDGIYQNQIAATVNFFYSNHPMKQTAEQITAGKHSTELFTDAALNYLKKDKKRPFFLSISYLAPHDPRTMPEEFHNMYNAQEISLPSNFAADHPFWFGVGDESRDEALAFHPRKEAEIRQHICDYYAMISHLDHNIGKIIEQLKHQGLWENTILVFTSDNGLAVGQHGLMGKQNLYDSAVHIPLLIGGGALQTAAAAEDYIYLFDLYPTLCRLCGVPVPESVEGRSFADLWKADNFLEKHDCLYGAFTDLIRSVSDKEYKLILYRLAPQSSQLFDLQADPAEEKNLFEDPALRTVKSRMLRKLIAEKLKWETDETNSFTSSFWHSEAIRHIFDTGQV